MISELIGKGNYTKFVKIGHLSLFHWSKVSILFCCKQVIRIVAFIASFTYAERQFIQSRVYRYHGLSVGLEHRKCQFLILIDQPWIRFRLI